MRLKFLKDLTPGPWMCFGDFNEISTARSTPKGTTLEKPPVESVKVNWDASISKDAGFMGVGVVVRDHASVVIASFCTSKLSNLDPASVEALGAWHATEVI